LDRDSAWKLLTEYVKNDKLLKHSIAVEACMREYARKFGEDEEKWGVVGLLHDIDYELYPSFPDHPIKGAGILRERGYPEDVVRAVLAHADHTGVERRTLMEKALYAVDELAGFVVAVALVKPGKSLSEVDPRSVRKKMKDKAFAAGVSREAITRGAEELGVDLDEHIAVVVEAMKKVADKLGLGG
jgi:putative nucleotidyltransferase with HDIG domain